MLPIAVDAMGGDRAPGEVLAGVHQAASRGIPVVLVGPPGLDGIGEIPLIEASEVIEMHDDAAAGVRRKKDSTLVRAAEAVRDGRASAMVSAGNTGAAMAAALLRMGRVKGVNRPAIATTIPVPGQRPNILLDSGANAEVQAEWMVQFAQMGSVYARHRFGVQQPTVGLLSIGEEPGKGDTLRKETFALLQAAPGIRFVGNVEGRDLMTKTADVVVTDGFTGNVALKALEGALKTFFNALLTACGSSPEYKAAADALLPALSPLHAEMSPETYGGAALLGVDGVCIIGHGSSNATSIANAIGLARDLVESRLVDEIRTAVAASA